MDWIIVEALLRSVRTVALVTGALVVADSIKLLFAHVELPPHKPRLSALAWLVMGCSVAGVSAYLLVTKASWVEYGDALPEKLAVIALYFGAAVAFTIRAMARAERPWLAALATFGMTGFGMLFALEDLLL